jgi:cytochrome c-type biogenesis protein CcmE
MVLFRSRMKILVAAVVLSLAVGYLAFAGIQAGRTYYLSVDAFLADPAYHGQRVRLHGAVGSEGLQVDTGLAGARFLLRGQATTLPVTYQGVIPDLFRPGCDVVVEGTLGQDRAFRADKLLTKCASKYDRRSEAGGRSP